MPPGKTRAYRSFLLRCWTPAGPASDARAHMRFVVESISGEPRRWGFDTFETLIAFLRAELLVSRDPETLANDQAASE